MLEERRALVSQCAVCRGIETYAGLLLVKVRRQKLALVQQRGEQRGTWRHKTGMESFVPDC